MLRFKILIIFLFVINMVVSQNDINNDGYNIFYHENGKKSSEGFMRDGKPDGYWKTYNLNEILISEGNRKNFELDSTWKFYDDKIIIEDSLNKETNAVVRLHFHPSIDNKMIEKHICIQNVDFNIQNYKYAPEFNTLVDAKLIEIAFKKNCKVEIKI